MLERAAYVIEFLPPHAVEQPKKPDPKDGVLISTAYELRSKVFAPIRYLVEGYLAEGATILAGRPKICKSWLALEISIAVASASTCLGGIRCDEPGDVLFLGLEDNQRRLRSRLDKLLGPIHEWPARLHFATEWPRANDGGLEAIRDWILSAEKPRLVVVDVLAMFRPLTRGTSGNPYEADYLAIKGLQALASEFRIALLIITHVRKSGSDVDAIEKVSGTLGLSGAADTIMVLDRDGNGATIYARGRDVEEVEVAVEFDKPTCRWRVLGQAADVRRTNERNVILQTLLEADDAMTPLDISKETGEDRNNVDQLLLKMARTSEVQKVGRGQYVHPDRSDLISAQPPYPDKNDKKVRNTGIKQSYKGARDGEEDPSDA